MSPDDDGKGVKVVVSGTGSIALAVAKLLSEHNFLIGENIDPKDIMKQDQAPIDVDMRYDHCLTERKQERALAKQSYKIHGQKGFGRYKS